MDSGNANGLRRQIRQRRAALPAQQQRAWSKQAASHLRRQRAFRNAKHIAIYLPVRGEADPQPLLRWALPHQTFYLPVLSPTHPNTLWFIRWDRHTPLRLNRFRILEPIPIPAHRRAARWLDLAIVPLVAFDHRGTRLGMGGGFYDRTFAFKRWHRHHTRPQLCGLAYAFQQQPALHRQAWDVPLDAIATEHEFFCFGTRIY